MDRLLKNGTISYLSPPPKKIPKIGNQSVLTMGIWLSKLWRLISRQRCEIGTWCQRITNRKRPTVVAMVTWPMTSRDRKGQGRDPEMFEAQYLGNHATKVTWRQQTTNRKGPSAIPMVTWLMTSRDPMGQTRYPETNRGLNAKRVDQWVRYLVP